MDTGRRVWYNELRNVDLKGKIMIRFEEITNKNIWKVCSLEPFDEQKDFVAENIQSLAEAYVWIINRRT